MEIVDTLARMVLGLLAVCAVGGMLWATLLARKLRRDPPGADGSALTRFAARQGLTLEDRWGNPQVSGRLEGLRVDVTGSFQERFVSAHASIYAGDQGALEEHRGGATTRFRVWFPRALPGVRLQDRAGEVDITADEPSTTRALLEGEGVRAAMAELALVARGYRVDEAGVSWQTPGIPGDDALDGVTAAMIRLATALAASTGVEGAEDTGPPSLARALARLVPGRLPPHELQVAYDPSFSMALLTVGRGSRLAGECVLDVAWPEHFRLRILPRTPPLRPDGTPYTEA